MTKGTDSQMAKEETKVALLALVLVVLLAPVNALITAKVASSLWDQLIAPQYGAGPAYPTWYGASLIWSYFMYGVKHDDKPEGLNTVAWAIQRTLVSIMFGLTMVGIAHLVRFSLGWP